MDLAQASEKLAGITDVMYHYDKYQNYHQRWFLSHNPHLLASARKPGKFETWEHWDEFNIRQKFFILDLTGISENGLVRNKETLAKLIAGYKSGWKWTNLYPIFWGTEVGSSETTNTCNLFLGDAMYLAGIENLNSERKYYSARQIWNGNHPRLKEVKEKKQLKRGDVAAFGGTHVEIVTRVYSDWLRRDAFCSRGGYRTPLGGEKCGSEMLRFWASDRLVDEDTIRFFALK
jgi:hypothetical protein